MPLTLRADQTVTFTVEWKDSLGNVVPAPAGTQIVDSDSAHVKVEDLGGGTYKVTPLSLTASPATVGIGSPNVGVTDTVTVAGGVAASGKLVWGTPTPA